MTPRYYIEAKASGLYRIWTLDGEIVIADNVPSAQLKYYR